MLSIVFEADITDGIIKIPAEHRLDFQDRATVILLRNDDALAESDDIIAELLDHPVEIKDFHPLSRDEIYAC